jgi:putative transposase
VLAYRSEGGKEVFLARAYAQNLETETISLDEAKASIRRVREVGKTVSNSSMRLLLILKKDYRCCIGSSKERSLRDKNYPKD